MRRGRRRRAERLSRLPMRVVPEAGAEALAGPLAKGGKHPAVDIFGSGSGSAAAPRPIGLRSGGPCHAPQTKKSRRLERARSKILCRAKSGTFPSTSTTTITTTSLLIDHFSTRWCLSARVRQGGLGFNDNDISIRCVMVRLFSFHPFISSATGRACPFMMRVICD